MFKFTQLLPTQQAQCFGPGSFPDTTVCAGKVVAVHLQDIEKMAKPILDAMYEHWLRNQAEDKPALVLLDVPHSVFPNSERNQVNISEKRANLAPLPRVSTPIPSTLLYMASGTTIDPPQSPTGDSTSTATSPATVFPPEVDEAVTLEFNQKDVASGATFRLCTQLWNASNIQSDPIPVSTQTKSNPQYTPLGAPTQHVRDAHFIHRATDVDSDYGDMDLDFGGDAYSDEDEPLHIPRLVSAQPTPAPTLPAVTRNDELVTRNSDMESDYGELELDFGGDSECGDQSSVTFGEQGDSEPHLFTFAQRLPSPMTPAKALQRDPTPQFVSEGVPILRSTRKRTVVHARDRLPTLVASHSTVTPSQAKRPGAGLHDILETKKQKGGTGVKPRPKAKFGGNSTAMSTVPMDSSLDDDPYNRGKEERSKRRRT